MTNSPIAALVIALVIGAPVIAPTFGIIIISNIIIINIIIINIIINLIHYYSSLILTSLAVIGLITANAIAPMTANYIYY
jgi:hypothetical protein